MVQALIFGVMSGAIRAAQLFICRIILLHAPAELVIASTVIKTLQKLSTASNSQQSFIKAHTAIWNILHYTTDPIHKKYNLLQLQLHLLLQLQHKNITIWHPLYFSFQRAKYCTIGSNVAIHSLNIITSTSVFMQNDLCNSAWVKKWINTWVKQHCNGIREKKKENQSKIHDTMAT